MKTTQNLFTIEFTEIELSFINQIAGQAELSAHDLILLSVLALEFTDKPFTKQSQLFPSEI